MKKYKAIVAGVALLAVPAIGFADAINVDIQGDVDGGPGWWMNVGTYSGAAAAGADAGDTWNGTIYPFGGTASGKLVDDTGAATDVQIYSSTTKDHWSVDYGSNPAGEMLMADYAFNTAAWVGDGSDALFTIYTDNTALTGGLAINAGQQYDVYIYAQGDTAGATTFSLKQDSGDIVQTATTAGGFDGTWTEGVNYVKFSNVTATSWANGGELAINWGGSNSAINGIQIVQIPEPATIGLIGIVGAGAIFVRRRFMI